MWFNSVINLLFFCMDKFFDTCFNGLTVWQKVDFCVALLLSFSIPLSWRFSAILLILWLLVAVVHCFADSGAAAPKGGKRGRGWFMFFALFYVIHGISMFYTENLAEGWATLEKRLSFLVLPLMFLVFDFSYLNRQRVRVLLYAFCCGALAVVCADLATAAWDVAFRGAGSGRFFDAQLSSEHHAYISMHICLAIIFCFSELVLGTKTCGLWFRVALVVALVLFTVSTVLLSSRAGVLCMVAVYLMLFLWMIFGQKMYRAGAVAAVTAVLAVAVVIVAMPNALQRISNTFKSVASAEKSEDVRITILRSTVPVACENWLTGVGVGDKIDAYMAQYRKDGNTVCLEREYNSHNQFVDTMTVTGIAGLTLLLSFFVVPAALAIRNRRFNVVFALFLFMVFFNALFESVFEKQAGILFFVLFFVLMFNAEFVTGNKTAEVSDK